MEPQTDRRWLGPKALGALIAGAGRKFGLHLFVATQRPGKVHSQVVSQCDNLILTGHQELRGFAPCPSDQTTIGTLAFDSVSSESMIIISSAEDRRETAQHGDQ